MNVGIGAGTSVATALSPGAGLLPRVFAFVGCSSSSASSWSLSLYRRERRACFQLRSSSSSELSPS